MRNWLSIYQRRLVCDAPRSDRWPTVRRHHLAAEGWCRWCGSTKDLQVHHIEPFHLCPAKELDPGNLITLCETLGVECHLKHGHLGNWKMFNPRIRAQANSTAPGKPATPSQLRTAPPIAVPGFLDIGLVRGTDLISKAIEQITRSPYSHALIICPDGSVYESLSDGGVQHNPSVNTKHAGEQVDIFKVPVTLLQAQTVIAFCESQLGKPYDLPNDMAFIGGGTETTVDTSKWFCSELVFYAFQQAGINLLARVLASQVSPGMLGWSPELLEAA